MVENPPIIKHRQQLIGVGHEAPESVLVTAGGHNRGKEFKIPLMETGRTGEQFGIIHYQAV